MYLRAIGAIALLILSVSAVTARGPYGSVKIGNWSGGAYTNDTDRRIHRMRRIGALQERHHRAW